MSVYGKCPECGANGIARQKRLNGNDICENNHEYKSSDAINPERFELRTGKFGVYFYDILNEQDLPLDAVLAILNKAEK